MVIEKSSSKVMNKSITIFNDKKQKTKIPIKNRTLVKGYINIFTNLFYQICMIMTLI